MVFLVCSQCQSATAGNITQTRQPSAPARLHARRLSRPTASDAAEVQGRDEMPQNLCTKVYIVLERRSC